MQDLNDLYYFVRVVDNGGFTAAGKVLDIPKSTLSRRLTELESRLGVRLIQRTSRSFVVTDIGHEFYRHAKAMLLDAEAAEDAVTRRLSEPSGTVRITCSTGMAVFALSDLLPRFMAEFPKVTVVAHVTNRYVDIVDEGFDIGLRAHWGAMTDSSLVQRVLTPTPWKLFASPALLGGNIPDDPGDLSDLPGLLLAVRANEPVWQLKHRGGAETVVAYKPRLHCDDMTTLKKAAIAGIGIVALPAYIIRPEVLAGTLMPVLPDWAIGEATVSLVMPSRRGLSPAVRVLADFLIEEFPEVVGN
jgi:DNA-binding transcriptional LysR family regulator